MKKLTQKELKRILHYNPTTGLFTWKINHKHGSKKKNTIAGYKNNDGYVCIKISNTLYYAHILVFLYMNNYYPENFIDHKDKTPWNNWYINLRETSQQCNMRNRKRNKNNKSGVTGVSWVLRDSIWWSSLKVYGVIKNLGRYKNKEDAICARLAGEQCLGWETCNNITDAHRYVKEHIQ